MPFVGHKGADSFRGEALISLVGFMVHTYTAHTLHEMTSKGR